MSDADEPHLHRFTFKAVNDHLRIHHPGCSSNHRKAIAARVVRKAWTSGKIGEAVGICIDGYVRHALTDYDSRLAAGENRDLARSAVRDRTEAIKQSWATRADVAAT